MNGQDILMERNECLETLKHSTKKLHENGQIWAEKDAAYDVALAQKLLELESKGEVKMAIIKEIAKGDEKVAYAKFEKNAAEVNYKCSGENINVQKKRLESLEATIKREVG